MGTSTLIEGLLPPAFDDPRSCEAKKRGRSSGNVEEESSGLDNGPVYDVYGDVRPDAIGSSILPANCKEPMNSS
jgi:hypothetical protein